jgi:hypothetical protein
MLLLTQPQQTRLEQGAVFQVEGIQRFYLYQMLRSDFPFGLGQGAEVFHKQGQVQGCSGNLHRLPCAGRKGGAQDFVAFDNFVEALL